MKDIVLGTQYMADFYECSSDLINDRNFVRQRMLEAATLIKATIVTDVFHEFNPHGLSGVVVIAESHMAIHSWPEYRCVSIDIFTCSDQMVPEDGIEHLKIAFQAKRVEVQKVVRGTISQRELKIK
jgi:S-adenosylmethionine decarboxylase